MLQGDSDPSGKGKIRAKKASSKYNEEISSDSETEGFVSDVAHFALCINHSFYIWSWAECDCVSSLSPDIPRKRRSNEEHEYEETPQEKKLRLAKVYLDQLKEEGKPCAIYNMVWNDRIWLCIYCNTSSQQRKIKQKRTHLRQIWSLEDFKKKWWECLQCRRVYLPHETLTRSVFLPTTLLFSSLGSCFPSTSNSNPNPDGLIPLIYQRFFFIIIIALS